MMPIMSELEHCLTRLNRLFPKEVCGYVLLDPIYLPQEAFDRLKKEHDLYLENAGLKALLGMKADFSTWLINKFLALDEADRNGKGGTA